MMRRTLGILLSWAAVACSESEAARPRDDAADVPVFESADARARIEALRQRFVVDTVEPGEEYEDGGASRVVHVPAIARVATGRRRGARAHVAVPRLATDAIEIRDAASNVAVEIALDGAARVTAEDADDVRLFRGAGPFASDWMLQPNALGLEDYVVIDRAPPREEIVYRIDVAHVAGLRRVADVVELLDGAGAPRLRFHAVFAVDAAGIRHPLRVDVDGCAYDVDPRAPWGRAVTPPGSRTCALRVAWPSSGVRYPLLVDPAWTSTGSMNGGRSSLVPVVLASGLVLIEGGNGGTFAWQDAQLYDPKTGTWAETGSMEGPRGRNSATLLASGRVLAAGGQSDAVSTTAMTTAEIYDPASGTWTPTPDMPVGYAVHGAALLPNGKVLLAGGTTDPTTFAPQSACALYDESVNAWTATTPMIAARTSFGMALLGSGKVLAHSGVGLTPTGSVTGLTSAELYDPNAGTWTATGSLSIARAWVTSTVLLDGRVLTVGGKLAPTSLPNEIYAPANGTWSAAAPSILERIRHSAVLLSTGQVLVAGDNPPSAVTELYDPFADTWTLAGDMEVERLFAGLCLLPSGQALVAGGYDGSVRLASAELFSLSHQGDTCAVNGECLSGYCVDGRCCDSACAGPCLACSAAVKGGGADGVCGPVPAGLDPDGDCTPSPCVNTGACDGSGACAIPSAGTPCAPPSCSSGLLTTATCDGIASCTTSTSACSPYVCADTTACHTSCNDDGQCAAGAFCDIASHVCVGQLDNGVPCTAASECSSGYCVDGVCCDSACNGLCQACSAATKASGVDGACGFAKDGVDPHDDCPDDGAVTCQRDGTCDGMGACRDYALGIRCGPTVCIDATTQSGFGCSGSGQCLPALTVPCGAYACADSACRTSCSSDADCASTAFCDGQGTCQPRLANGTACTANHICKSGQCVDGYCCNTPCSGSCQACDAPGGEGACVPIAGAPHGTREPCPGGGAADPCAATACDGIAPLTCAGFVGGDVACRMASCTDGVAILAAACNGQGTCADEQTIACAPFACAGDSCATACNSDADCAPLTHCDASTQKCVGGALCSDEHTVQSADGQSIECAPYKCEAGACKKSCATVLDCVTPAECDPSGACTTSTGDATDAGCSCRVGSSERSGRSGPLALLVAIAFAVARRRRRHAMAALGVASTALLVGCGDRWQKDPSAGWSEAPKPEIAASPHAVQKLAMLRERYRVSIDDERAPVLPVGGEAHFEATSRETVRAIAAGTAARAAIVEIARRASGPTRVEEVASHLAIAFKARGASDAPLAIGGGAALYEQAQSGGDLVERPRADGVEDYVFYPDRPAREEIVYSVDVSRVAGLRLVAGELAFVDREGVPRLRMASPYVADAEGVQHPASIRLGGCAADVDPRGPWGRAPVAPGAAECDVHVTWSDAGVRYPAALDPAWTTTGSMANARAQHAAMRLATGQVVVSGGRNSTASELYDPTTGTWAATGSNLSVRLAMGSAVLTDGRLLVAGGMATNNTVLATAEIYDPATGVWSATGSMTSPREALMAVALPNGGALVAGGHAVAAPIAIASAEIYSPATNAWTATAPMAVPRFRGMGAPLPSGKVLIAGGRHDTVDEETVELFDSTTGTWAQTGSMHEARRNAQLIALQNGKVLVAGGWAAKTSTEIYDPASGAWTLTGKLAVGRHAATMTELPDGRVLIAGGAPQPGIAESEIFDPATGIWSPAGSMTMARWIDSATLLADGRVLAAGGRSHTATSVIYTNTAEIFAFAANGSTCVADAECASGHCVDGACCDKACTGTCVACSIAKTGSANGTCAPVTKDTDPDNECAADPVASCGQTGACNGAGACALYASGVVCSGPSCVGGSVSLGTCNGLGSCAVDVQTCAPYVCADATSCSTSCNADTDCAASGYCNIATHTCASDQPNGAPCASPTQCASAFCVDGVCCNSACNALCESCAAATKASGQQDGVCGAAAVGTDPHNDCAEDGPASCKRDGQCDGAGACRKYAAGTPCGQTTCSGNVQTGYACDGVGTCQSGVLFDCNAFLCQNGACTTSCASSSDCAADAWCNGSNCELLKAKGETCSIAASCATGFCVDAHCCDGVCDGVCEACDVSGGEGTCMPVVGKPHGTRPACPIGDPANPCSATQCDGSDKDTKECKGFADSTVVCRDAACSDGVQTAAATCDGTGKCRVSATKQCAPYVCEGTACKTSCASDADCTGGTSCDATTHECVAAAACSDAHTLRAPGGQKVDCSPFTCDPSMNACRTTCSSVLDCVAPSVCDETGACVVPNTAEPTPTDQSGCSCRLTGSRARGGPRLLALFALAFVAALRRGVRWRSPAKARRVGNARRAPR